MAKAAFHKGQRVYVRPLGTWAHVERLVPHWVKDVEEPLRVLYDLGLGRDFAASELMAEVHDTEPADDFTERWRVVRRRNRLTMDTGDARHPRPGTHPAVVTEDNAWGGWRVPASEYDRDPDRIEFQARLLAQAPELVALARALVDFCDEQGIPLVGPAPPGVRSQLAALGARAQAALTAVHAPDESIAAVAAE
jgi:hypothetical protein